MSFRTAYTGFKSPRNASKPRGYFRDYTAEQWKRKLDEYYIQQQKNKSGR